MDNSLFFEPFTLKSLQLKNRFVMAPMTRAFSPDGIPKENVADYYRKRAEGEVGLILSEGTVVERHASANNSAYPHFYGAEALQGWKNVIDGVHNAGGKMGPQLWHVGIVQPGGVNPLPQDQFEGPSGLSGTGVPVAKTMSEEDIADTISAFARSAANAKRLGFDMLEIHGAHSYLIDQFFWEVTNRRTDRYGGGTLAERTCFGAEVVRAVRNAVGEDFVISLRISQWKIANYEARLAVNPDGLAAWLAPLTDAGVDIYHCSQRRFWEAEFEGSDLNLAGWVKKVTGKPTITVGSIGLSGEFMAALRQGEGSQPEPLTELHRRFERGDFDLIGIGRALITDPDWVKKTREGRNSELLGYSKDSLATLL